MLVREDTRRKCGELVVVNKECEKIEEGGDGNGMKREWREEREVRPVKMEDGRKDNLLSSRYEEKRGMR